MMRVLAFCYYQACLSKHFLSKLLLDCPVSHSIAIFWQLLPFPNLIKNSHDLQSDPPEDLEITTLEDGYFGELALVTHKPRAASIYAVGDITVART